MTDDQRITRQISRDSVEFIELTKKEVTTGICLSFQHFFQLLAFVLLILYSYSWWGSPVSPLQYLLWPAVVSIVIAIVLSFITKGMLRHIMSYRIIPELGRKEDD